MFKSRSLDLLFNKYTRQEHITRHSVQLGREVALHVFLPPHYLTHRSRYPVLYLNDGQDMEAIHLLQTLDQLYSEGNMQRIIVVAICAGDRIQEYGTQAMPDYLHRGSKARAYTRFVTEELMPYINHSYRTIQEPGCTAFAGFSLGGLSAFDIAWAQPALFGIAGVFSGALWWRSRAYEESYTDADRIIHQVVRSTDTRPLIRAWFEAGTEDETDDRNQNGIIDAIDDTLDLMGELEQKGHRRDHEIRYVEVPGGKHDYATWAAVMPDFLTWTFPPLR
jgi:enterochelin esterase-like enzyme